MEHNNAEKSHDAHTHVTPPTPNANEMPIWNLTSKQYSRIVTTAVAKGILLAVALYFAVMLVLAVVGLGTIGISGLFNR